jgi:hypothetical protein
MRAPSGLTTGRLVRVIEYTSWCVIGRFAAGGADAATSRRATILAGKVMRTSYAMARGVGQIPTAAARRLD